jgi:hypothetical protein
VWRDGLGGAYLLPTLSSVGASLTPPCRPLRPRGVHRLYLLSLSPMTLPQLPIIRFRRAEGFRGFTGSLSLRPVELLVSLADLTGVFPSQRRLLPPSFPPGRSPFPAVGYNYGGVSLSPRGGCGLFELFRRSAQDAVGIWYGFGSGDDLECLRHSKVSDCGEMCSYDM